MSAEILNQKCSFFPACGGCNYLNLSDEEYFARKKNKLKEILKTANLDIEFDFYSVGAHSRRKIILQIDDKNNLGFFAKATNKLVEIDACYIAENQISQIFQPLKEFLKTFENNLITQITITLFDNVIDVIFNCKRELNFAQMQKISQLAQALKINASYRFKNEIIPILLSQKNQIFYPHFAIDLEGDIFIQATKKGLEKITEIIRESIQKTFSKKIFAVDIYAGFGAYSFAIADLAKEIKAYEGSEKMVQLIHKNAAKNSLGNIIKSYERDLIMMPLNAKDLQNCDLAIINPPRNGAGPQAQEIADSKLNNIIYVSCNPQSFVRDAKILFAKNFQLTQLTAIDQFYGGDHLELVAIFKR